MREPSMFKALEMHDPLENCLLSSLSAEERVRLYPSMRHAFLPPGRVIYDAGERLDSVYFPTTCVVSCLYTMLDGSTAEMALVGNDGMIGIALVLGGGNIPHRAVAQIGGYALTIPAKVLQDEFARGGPLQHSLLRYTQALITQISQTAVCNRLHPLQQRLCRWLLMTHDRAQTDKLQMTQEFISHMLGVR